MLGTVGGGVAAASNPGNNGRLAYEQSVESSTIPGEWAPEIYTMNPDGSDVQRLTLDAGQYADRPGSTDFVISENRSPAWSPRGDAIAYVHVSPTEEYSIRLMDPEGTPLGTVTDAFEGFANLAWSPDGKQLAFTAYGYNPILGDVDGVLAINVDGTEPRILFADSGTWPAPGLARFHDLAWSPNGDVIAFTAFEDEWKNGRRVYVMDTDGSNVRRIECGLAWTTDLEWSADGSVLFCSSDETSGEAESVVVDWDLWGARMPDGTAIGQLTALVGDEREPLASPDGSVVVFTHAGALWSLDPLVRITAFAGSGIDWQPLQGSFWDDESSVFRSDIDWMAGEGITKGCNPPLNDRYCPDAAVTRGQVAAFLVRALGLTDRLDDPFIDDDSSVFEADIEKLAAAGITKGCNPPANDRFCPDAKVTTGSDGGVPRPSAWLLRQRWREPVCR